MEFWFCCTSRLAGFLKAGSGGGALSGWLVWGVPPDESREAEAACLVGTWMVPVDGPMVNVSG